MCAFVTKGNGTLQWCQCQGVVVKISIIESTEKNYIIALIKLNNKYVVGGGGGVT